MVAIDFDRSWERPMRRIPARQMRIGVGIAKIIDGNYRNMLRPMRP